MNGRHEEREGWPILKFDDFLAVTLRLAAGALPGDAQAVDLIARGVAARRAGADPETSWNPPYNRQTLEVEAESDPDDARRENFGGRLVR